MSETVICAPVRTAVGRYGGVFRDGLETMCIGGGQGLAALFERVA
jgi:acetyl-CoA acetyltransferase